MTLLPYLGLEDELKEFQLAIHIKSTNPALYSSE
jgi:hypothetical protein